MHALGRIARRSAIALTLTLMLLGLIAIGVFVVGFVSLMTRPEFS